MELHTPARLNDLDFGLARDLGLVAS